MITLTNPRMAIETFGLTTLEAMSSGLPVIVPTQGGIAEMVSDGKNGYKMNVMELQRIERTIRMLFEDKALYSRLSTHALNTSRRYDSTRLFSLLTNQLSQ